MGTEGAQQNSEDGCAVDQCSTCPSGTQCVGRLNPSSTLSSKSSTLVTPLCTCRPGFTSWAASTTGASATTPLGECTLLKQGVEFRDAASFIQWRLNEDKFVLLGTRFFLQLQFRTRSTDGVILAAYGAVGALSTIYNKYFILRVFGTRTLISNIN